MSGEQRIAIAESTLAACESGRYVNAADAIVEVAAAIEAARRGTRLYDLATYAGAVRACARATTVEVSAETTLAAIARLAGRGHVACLNFASAKNPGGGFLRGSLAQEETLARSSGLYPCLLEVPAHYQRNRAHRSALYLDLAIWSPRVPFFRDDEGGWLAAPVACSVVTCAAPNAAALRQHGTYDAVAIEDALRRRARFVLAIARDQQVDTLILGAWGAGAFGGDPRMAARAFRDHLAGDFARVFGAIVFAIPPGPNLDAFREVLL